MQDVLFSLHRTQDLRIQSKTENQPNIKFKFYSSHTQLYIVRHAVKECLYYRNRVKNKYSEVK